MSYSDRPHSRRSRFGYVVAGIVAAVVSVLIYAGFQFLSQNRGQASKGGGVLDNPAIAESKNAPTSPEGIVLKKTSESFRMVAKKVGPAIVNIKSTKGGKAGGAKGTRSLRRGPRRPPEGEGSPFGGGEGGDPFQDFFERFGPFFQQPDQSPQTSLGSGILIDKDGTVVTNNHVVEGASEILVSIQGEKVDLKAKVIGTDVKTDLAVLKIEDKREFPSAEWADSDSVEVGDWAIAIGSPFALGQSVTVGIVSAKGGRNSMLTGVEYGGDLIQTDAAINPGNSGGPLCDLDGKVMGVNTAIYTRSGGYMGIGFAIPSNLAKEVVGKLRTDGKVVRGWLGVYIQAVEGELAKDLGIKDGVGIHEVIEGSPAATAGLKAGDVVLEVEGKPVSEVASLQRTISSFKPGQTVKLKVISYTDKKTRTVTVKIGELPTDDAKGGATPGEGPKDSEPDKLGLVVSLAKSKDGVVVEGVEPGSVAHQVGIETGDVIVRINRKPMDSLNSYKKTIEGARRLFVEVKRKGRTLFYTFTLPE